MAPELSSARTTAGCPDRRRRRGRRTRSQADRGRDLCHLSRLRRDGRAAPPSQFARGDRILARARLLAPALLHDTAVFSVCSNRCLRLASNARPAISSARRTVDASSSRPSVMRVSRSSRPGRSPVPSARSWSSLARTVATIRHLTGRRCEESSAAIPASRRPTTAGRLRREPVARPPRRRATGHRRTACAPRVPGSNPA